MKKLKLAIVNNFLPPYRASLFEDFMKDPEFDTRVYILGTRRHTRQIWARDAQRTESRVIHLKGIGIKIRERSSERIFFNPDFSRIAHWNPDVVLMYGYQDVTMWILALVCRLRRIPYILVADITAEGGNTMSGRLSLPLVRMIVANASHLIPSSRTCCDFLTANGGNPMNCTIMPIIPDRNLVNASFRLKSNREIIRHELQLTARIVVIFVGRLTEDKGIRELTKAIETCTVANHDLMFLFIGEGPMRTYVKEFCSEHPDTTRFFGQVDDFTLHRLYAAADIHVMPSHAEAFGVVCSEAQVFGVPSIVTKNSGCADLVVDGVNGILIDPRSSSSLADAINMLAFDSDRLETMKRDTSKAALSLVSEDIHGRMKNVLQRVVLDEPRQRGI